MIVKDLANGPTHVIDAASPLFGLKEPEGRVALWIQVDDQHPFVMVRSQTGTNMDRIRGFTDASFEIDKRNDLAHPGICSELTAKQIQYLGARKKEAKVTVVPLRNAKLNSDRSFEEA